MMKKYIFASFLLFVVAGAVVAQDQGALDGAQASDQRVRFKSPLDTDLGLETFEVEYFANQLALLKSAFKAANTNQIVVSERNLVEAMRREIDQMEEKVASDKAQTERRKRAASGTPEQVEPTDKPKYDPFAEASTDSEKRLETMRYTMAAFERHSFDPSNEAQGNRDFAKLEAFLSAMQEELEVLKQIKK
jgi:hypothetical protein